MLKTMQHPGASKPTSGSPSFAGILAAIAAPGQKKPPARDRSPRTENPVKDKFGLKGLNADSLGDEVATLSYERALRAHARYRAPDAGFEPAVPRRAAPAPLEVPVPAALAEPAIAAALAAREAALERWEYEDQAFEQQDEFGAERGFQAIDSFSNASSDTFPETFAGTIPGTLDDPFPETFPDRWQEPSGQAFEDRFVPGAAEPESTIGVDSNLSHGDSLHAGPVHASFATEAEWSSSAVPRDSAPPPDLAAQTIRESRLKTSSLTIRLSHAECDQVRQRAAEAGLSVSAYMRSCMFETETLRALVKTTMAQMRFDQHLQQQDADARSSPPHLPWLQRLLPWRSHARAQRLSN